MREAIGEGCFERTPLAAAAGDKPVNAPVVEGATNWGVHAATGAGQRETEGLVRQFGNYKVPAFRWM